MEIFVISKEGSIKLNDRMGLQSEVTGIPFIQHCNEEEMPLFYNILDSSSTTTTNFPITCSSWNSD